MGGVAQESHLSAVNDDIGRALSPRETEVLALLPLGLTNSEIAAQLRVTVHAVKFHLAGIYRKLGVANRAEATAAYLTRMDRAGVPGGLE
jgi:DNA-binding NarL/FixJ family response regulator